MEPTSPKLEPQPSRSSQGKTLVIVGGLVFAGLFIAGVMPRIQQERSLNKDLSELTQSAHEVNVVTPRIAQPDSLVLPCSIRALEETQVFARTSGYMFKRYVDIGSRVKAGQILAEIQSPDVDQQELQALADQAKSVAAVGQAQSDVQNKQAGVMQTQAEVARSRAAIEQAKAVLVGSQSKLMQAKAAQASSVAKLAQSRQVLVAQRATLKQAEAQHELAAANASRYRSLMQQGFIARQDADQAEANLKTTSASVDAASASIAAAEATVDAVAQDLESSKAAVRSAEADVESSRENLVASRAALSSTQAIVKAARAIVGSSLANVNASIAQVNSSRANAQRFDVLKSFSRVVAPFDGVITLRNTDVGSLVSPGDASNSKLALFTIARVDTLRIQVGVPQTYFQSVRPGTKANLVIREIPGKRFEGTVFQNAGAIDPNTRTLLTEIRIPNHDNLLIPGMFAEVQFSSSSKTVSMRIPSNTLLSDASGTRVIEVDGDNKLKFVRVKILRDFGSELELLDGLSGTERLVTNPTDDLRPGQSVRPLAEKKEPARPNP